MDRWLARLPGSPALKAGIASIVVCGGLAYPIFGRNDAKDGRQGHSYLSQEKPEVFAAHAEKQRREDRKAREEQQQQK